MDPRTYTAGEVLKDGTAVTIRAIQRGDKSRLLAAFKSLDRESVYRRFFSPRARGLHLTAASLSASANFPRDRLYDC